MHEIDFVIPWVDGSDPAWQKERCQYDPKAGSSNGTNDARFRDWDLLRYWFRAVEKYAPWVHKIYFVTWGHLPVWLNTDHEKLVIVNHRDYIPAEFLPTFNANTIELNFHRIPGLAEQFVYFNDDMFLGKPVQPEDFFRKAPGCLYPGCHQFFSQHRGALYRQRYGADQQVFYPPAGSEKAGILPGL